MALRPCLDCRRPTTGTRCLDHRRAREAARGSTTARGYGAGHQAEHARWAPVVDAGLATCAEVVCLMPSRTIEPGSDWHLAHDRYAGPTTYLGPAHALCNDSEAAHWHAGTLPPKESGGGWGA